MLLIVSSIVILLDQLTKHFATSMGMQMHLNTGISFGLFASEKTTVVLLIVLAVVLLVVTRGLWKESPKISGLFLGGILSNLIDRIAYGGVRDWLLVPFVGLYNNIADWAIIVAVIFWLYQSLQKRNNLEHAE